MNKRIQDKLLELAILSKALAEEKKTVAKNSTKLLDLTLSSQFAGEMMNSYMTKEKKLFKLVAEILKEDTSASRGPLFTAAKHFYDASSLIAKHPEVFLSSATVRPGSNEAFILNEYFGSKNKFFEIARELNSNLEHSSSAMTQI